MFACPGKRTTPVILQVCNSSLSVMFWLISDTIVTFCIIRLQWVITADWEELQNSVSQPFNVFRLASMPTRPVQQTCHISVIICSWASTFFGHGALYEHGPLFVHGLCFYCFNCTPAFCFHSDSNTWCIRYCTTISSTRIHTPVHIIMFDEYPTGYCLSRGLYCWTYCRHGILFKLRLQFESGNNYGRHRLLWGKVKIMAVVTIALF